MIDLDPRPGGTIALIVHDSRLRATTAAGLERDGYRVAGFATASAFACAGGHADAVLCDTSGDIALLRDGYRGPLIAIGFARSDEHVLGALLWGADDYLAVPFRALRLAARIYAVAARTASAESALTFGTIAVDIRERTVHVAGRRVDLTETEHLLLIELMRQPNTVRTHAELKARVWPDSPIKLGTIHTYISILRGKLNAAGGGNAIETVHGRGYRFGAQIATASSPFASLQPGATSRYPRRGTFSTFTPGSDASAARSI